jgi:hypothetical protein
MGVRDELKGGTGVDWCGIWVRTKGIALGDVIR